MARYFALASAHTHPPARATLEAIAWCYPMPTIAFEALRDHLAFYPGRVECTVAGEHVRSQPGGFYGGWITGEIVGPWKGEPGTGGW